MSEEKKPTDEEIAKAILQQIEYNAGIPYINEWQQVKTIKFTEILDFINRLQSNNEELKKDYIELDLECRELRTESDKKNTEIERLTAEINQRREMMSRMDCNYATELQKNADLQKQVDKCFMEVGKMCKEAEKDAAREIYRLIDMFPIPTRKGQQRYATGFENGLTAIKLKIAERYGVEVDYEN